MAATGYFAIALVSAVTVASPGPTIMFVVSQAIRRGFTTAGYSVVGILAADVFLILLASTGVTVAVSSLPVAWSVVRGLSAVYLTNLALRIIADNLRRIGAQPDPKTPKTGDDGANKPTSRAGMVFHAFKFQAGNIKAWLFFASLVPALMPGAANGVETALAALRILGVHLVVAALVMALYAGAGHLAGRLGSAPKWAMASELASAAVMLTLAIGLMANLSVGV